jgi:hypothetical protein
MVPVGEKGVLIGALAGGRGTGRGHERLYLDR